MNSRFLLQTFTAFAVLIVSYITISHPTFGQVRATQCSSTPVTLNTGSRTMLPINFNLANFTPLANPVIADITVDITWTVEDAACGSAFSGPVDLSAIRFDLIDPVTGNQILANTGAWTGSSPVNLITTSFVHNGTTLPAPAASGNYAPQSFSMDSYWRNSPLGNWELVVYHNGGGAAPICVHEVCITIAACDNSPINVSCLSNITLPLDSAGDLALQFDDLNDNSDTSCFLRDISFIPNNFTCVNHNQTYNIDMILTDRMGNISRCTANNITIVDNIAPEIEECGTYPNPVDTLYVNAGGTATLLAADVVTATDACRILTREIAEQTAPPFTYGSQRVFDCTNLGMNLVYVRASDASGNMQQTGPFSGCPIRVVLFDTITPTANCQDTTVYLDNNGEVMIDSSFVDDNSFDNCAAAILDLKVNGGSSILYDCTNLGVNNVTLTVRNNLPVSSGGPSSATCSAVVTVEDTIAPTAICANLSVDLSATGDVTVNASTVGAASLDNCSSSLTYTFTGGATDTTFQCANLGSNLVSVVVTDPANNSDACNAIITVNDVTPPVMSCSNITATLVSGTVAIVPSDIDGGTVDLCSPVTLSINTVGNSNLSFDCTDIGDQNVLLIGEDGAGNRDTCTAIVTIEDNTSPNPICRDTSVFLNSLGVVTVPFADIDGGSTDDCGIATYTISGGATVTYNCSDIGANNATLGLVDLQGNMASCVATVTVMDTTSPTLNCQNITASLDPLTGQVIVPATGVVLTSNDNCAVVSTTLLSGAADTTFSCTNIGINLITIIAEDAQGNSNSCVAEVDVVDNTLPDMSCLDVNVSLDALGNATVVPSNIDDGTLDNCGIQSLTFSNGVTTIDYDCSAIGTNTLTLVATDDNGNIDSCVAQVMVEDNTDPVANCQAFRAQLNSAGEVTVLPSDVDNLSSDNCGIVTYTINGQPSLQFSCADTSTTQNITLEVTDAEGNNNTCIATVAIRDTISPTPQCQAAPVLATLDLLGTVDVLAASIDDGSFDNCTTVTLLINGAAQQSYDCNNLGLNTAVLTVVDASGNLDSCIAEVNVQDNISPLALCVSPTISLDNTGQATITPTDIIDPASSDNCAITASTINNASSLVYDCTNLTVITAAPAAVTLEVSDASGNTATCPASVTIIDDIAPQATCQDITVQLNSTGLATVTGNDIDNGSIDNCNIASYLIDGSNSVVYNCSDIGSNSAELTVIDESANTSTCLATITVVDTELPAAVCQDINVYLDNAGDVTVNAVEIDGGSSDNCSPLTFLINNQPSFSYNCSQAGLTIPAQLSIRDPSNNTVACIAQITVLDTVSPIASCNTPVDVFLGTTGNVTVTAAQIDAGSSDNCSFISTSINGAASIDFDCTNIGSNTVNLMVEDRAGKQASCAAVVNVLDSLDPIVNCVNLTIDLDGSGQAVVVPTDIDNNSRDNCGVPNLTFSSGATSITYDCTNIGSNAATLVATDASGNSDSCLSNITIVDNLNPRVLCQDITVQLDPITGQVAVTTNDVDAGTTDNCGLATLTLGGAASRTFNCVNIGTNPVTLIATDVNGNIDSCTAVVTVEDVAAPRMSCQNITIALNSSGNATIVPSDIDNGTADNCGLQSLTINGQPSTSFNCTNIGTNSVTLIATDVNGNIDSCTAVVTVEDNTDPIAVCQTFDAYLDGDGNVTVTPLDINNSSSDNCGINTYTINGGTAADFSCADIGVQNVTLEVVDASGNSNSCTTTVTVYDSIAPQVICQDISRDLNTLGFVVIPAIAVDAGSSDSCGIASYSLSKDSFTCADIGSNLVRLYVTDVNGNIDSCEATITIRDNTPPTASCQNITAQLDASGNVTVLAAQLDAGSTDNCIVDSMTIDGQDSLSYSCANVGIQPVTFEVFDISGNSASCFAQVTISDNIAPTITCQNITAQLDASGNAIVNVTSVYTSTDDNCGVASVLFNNNSATVSYGCAEVGPNTVTVVVTDVNGNKDSCTAIVTIEDNIPPTATCQSATVFVDSTGEATVSPLDVDGGSVDACGIDSMYVLPSSLNCSNIAAPTTVTLTVVDNNGNSSTCNAQVRVEDNVSPSVKCQNTTVYLGALGTVSVVPSQIDGGTIDACGLSQLLINNSSNQIYTCTDTGVNTAVLRGVDIYGNDSTCNAEVTVVDTTTPDAQCRQPFDVFLDGNTGDVTISPTDVDSLSTDNCSINPPAYLVNGQSSITYTCADLFVSQNIILTIFDGSGNTSTCNTVVNVRDTSSPIADCQPIVNVNLSSLANNGTVTVNATVLNDNSTDVCVPPGTLSYLINNQPSFQYDCSNIGNNTAVLTVTDASGNSSTCTSTIVVDDITPPTAQCVGNITVNLDASGQYNLQGVDLNNNSSDNCSITSFLVNGISTQTYTCQDIGNNLATLTVSDSAGNSGTCTSVVSVRDPLDPVSICPTIPVPVFLDSSGLISISGTVIDSASYDNCGIETYLINGSLNQSYTCNDIGLNNAILTVRDSSNNQSSCVMQVDIRDILAPIANCQNITVSLGAGTGQAIVNATAINDLSEDNCGIDSYLINGVVADTFDCTNVGVNNVVLTVTDDYGNTNTCNATVTVEDNTAPLISCNNAQFFLDPSGRVEIQPTDVATGSDICGIANWTIDGLSSITYDCAVAETTLLDTIEAFDFSGNSAFCISQITISDTTSPTAVCNNITVQLDSFGVATVSPADIDDNSLDNCTIVTYLIDNQPTISYGCADTGVNTAILRVQDQSNNESVCSAVVTIEDNIAPVASCKNISIQLNADGEVVLPAINLNDASFDACGTIFTINGVANDTFNCSNTGPNLVTLEVTDPSGNISTCQSIVTVEDVTPPMVICKPFTVFLDNSGNGNISFADVVDVANSEDNCGIFLYTINNSTTTINYNCNDVGTDSVMVVAEDFNGNRDTCFSVVTIQDTVGPTVNCNDIIVDLTATGVDTLTIAQLGASASDFCGLDSMSISPQVITCADVGIVPVQVIAVDVNGNQTVCRSEVTVINDGPQPTNNAPATGICEGQTLGLFANPPATGFSYTYEWTGPNGFSSVQENPIITGVQAVNEGWYILEITPQGAPGCSTLDSTYVDVNSIPEPVLEVNDPLCNGSQAVLTVTNSTMYSGNIITYTWYQDGAVVGPDSSVYIIPAVSFSDTGLYTVRVNVDGCVDTSVVELPLIVNPLPAAFTPISNDPCEGDTLILTSNTPPTGTFTYSWEGPAGSTYSSTDSIASLAPVTLGDTGIYTITITDINTCTATSSVAVNVLPTPTTPSLNSNTPLCLDDILELTDTTTYSGTVNYVWLDPTGVAMDTTSVPQYTVVNATGGVYGLVVLENGCASMEDNKDIVYEPAPSVVDDAFNLAFRDSITGMDVTINDEARAGFRIEIVDSTNNGVIQLNNNATFNYRPDYIFFGIDSFHYEVCDAVCPTICDTATVFLDVNLDQRCFIPNGLSPNGDNINDNLVVVCRDQYPDMQIKIFSRWGTQVYKGDPNGWNAQFKGKDLPDGTYFYVLDYGDGTPPETGYIVVHR